MLFSSNLSALFCFLLFLCPSLPLPFPFPSSELRISRKIRSFRFARSHRHGLKGRRLGRRLASARGQNGASRRSSFSGPGRGSFSPFHPLLPSLLLITVRGSLFFFPFFSALVLLLLFFFSESSFPTSPKHVQWDSGQVAWRRRPRKCFFDVLFIQQLLRRTSNVTHESQQGIFCEMRNDMGSQYERTMNRRAKINFDFYPCRIAVRSFSVENAWITVQAASSIIKEEEKSEFVAEHEAAILPLSVSAPERRMRR